jgi:hypothetical protein
VTDDSAAKKQQAEIRAALEESRRKAAEKPKPQQKGKGK